MAPDRKTEILDAAGSCFARFGYEKTTMDDIGEMVGMNKVSLYYYFKNKETLFKEMIIREADQFSEMVRSRVKEIRGPRERLIDWIKTGFEFSQSGSILHQLSVESLSKLSPQLEELKEYAFQNGADYIASLILEGQQSGEFIACDAAKIGTTIQRVIYSIKDSAYQEFRNNPLRPMDYEKLCRDVTFTVGLILDGITNQK